MSEITVVDVSEAQKINDEVINILNDKLIKVLEMDNEINERIKTNHQELTNMTSKLNEEITSITNMLQVYSASIHTALHKTISSIDVINNTINNVGLPKNNSSNKSTGSSAASGTVSANNNNSNAAPKSTKRNISINILFSYVFRLLEGDRVDEAPDLQSIISKYEENNKINLRSILSVDSLLDAEEKERFEADWAKLKKESDKTNKKKAGMIWAMVKRKQEFSKKFESFKQYYCESSENRN